MAPKVTRATPDTPAARGTTLSEDDEPGDAGVSLDVLHRHKDGGGRFGSAALWGRALRGLGAVRGRVGRLRGRWSFSPAGFRRAWTRLRMRSTLKWACSTTFEKDLRYSLHT